ncbi:YicC family protein [Prosthecochloris sp. GSB1]|uniref:YicC/YloC family endoribonuclease n=1 Tax=Prosthecochloris sp. GSB1 TaxID=281093 RepID=UPI000B8CD3A3|nr:YicC/YloC family endoribonuclease [Prosthecochloris sp. GSB1]ASQ89867.1 YicC family protein [Prosthecochloris sp. GSB1]
MLESMTGYGNAECVKGGVRVVAEIRSVNNRFAEISVKLPRQFSPYELDARDLIRSCFQRGKISAYIQVQLDDEQQMPFSVNAEKTRACKAMLESVRQEAGIEAPVSLDHLLRFSEIFDSGSKLLEQTGEIWPFVRETLVRAAENLKKMRLQEGAELAGDFQERIASINDALEEVRLLSRGNVEAVRQRLAEKIATIAGNEATYSRDRLEMELVLAADKLDITEECIRFASHNKFFVEELLNEDAGSGRKLNFLLQEQLREANTIASKSQNADISQKIVHVKEELEKIREQIQNIE